MAVLAWAEWCTVSVGIVYKLDRWRHIQTHRRWLGTRLVLTISRLKMCMTGWQLWGLATIPTNVEWVFSCKSTIKFMQPLCLVQETTSRFGMNSVSQWTETDSACELLASQVSVYTPAVSSTDTEGGGWGC